MPGQLNEEVDVGFETGDLDGKKVDVVDRCYYELLLLGPTLLTW